MRIEVPFSWSLVWCDPHLHLFSRFTEISSICSPSSDSTRPLSSASLNLYSTGLPLLSPGVPTDTGEGLLCLASYIRWGLRIRALLHPALSLIVSSTSSVNAGIGPPAGYSSTKVFLLTIGNSGTAVGRIFFSSSVSNSLFTSSKLPFHAGILKVSCFSAVKGFNF